MASGLPRLTGGHAAAAASTGATQDSSLPPLTGGQAATSSSLPPLTGTTPVKSPRPHSGGGGFLHALSHLGTTIEHGAHWVGQKSELAATDLKNIPGGLVQAAGALDAPFVSTYELITHGSKAATTADAQGQKRFETFVKANAEGAKQTVEHPLRDPFQTALLAAGAASGVGSVAGRLAEAGRVINEGGSFADVAKAATARPPVKPRLLTKNGETVSLHASKNPTVRAVQEIHDRLIQRAIDQNPESRLAGYGTHRVGGSLDETARRRAAMRAAPANVLDRASLKIGGARRTLTGRARLHQAALELTSTNTTPEDAAAFHDAQAASGVEPARNRLLAKLYRKVAQKGLVTTNERRDVIVNAVDHPDLAKADVALHTVQQKGDEILARYGVRTPEQLQARVDAPARIRAGAKYEKPTPGKLGLETPGLKRARQRVVSLQGRIDRALNADDVAREQGLKNGLELKGPMRFHARTPQQMQQLRGAVAVAQGDLARNERAAARRIKPTGIVGGESARPGRGFVSYKLEQKNAPASPAAASPGSVVGETKSPIANHTFTGEGLAKGYVPKDITGPAAQNFRQIMRFVNTSERRAQAIRLGSPVKQTSRDVLVRIPGVEHDKIPAAVHEILGTSRLNVDKINGLHAALEDYKQGLIPGLKDRFARDNTMPVGTSAEDAAAAHGIEAPKGYVWVDRHFLGDLARAPRGPRGLIGRQVDNINSAVTAATVYFKIGHVGTRVLTNAVTNIIQGSASPLQIKASNQLWHSLDDTQKAEALAATGEHGFAAMPHAGVSRVSRVAGKGASWWARHADAPFRFNSLAYEARKAGFDTTEKFQYLLEKLKDPTGLDAAQTAKIEWVGKRANREAIAYDRLSAGEKQYLAGAIWFYPWVRATGSFLGNTILEHPYKAAVGGTLAKQSEQTQQRELGDLPSYERGLVKLAGGEKPLVADFSTFSPFATPADILDAASVGQAASMLNPVYGGLALAATRQNSFGQHSNHPISDAISQVFSPTPEAQILTGFLHRNKNQSRKMFPQSPGLGGTETPLLRSIIGPAMPRRMNLTAAHSAAARERRGR
jgi:hypothetical protein